METSELNWVDTHCHLYSSEFDQDRHEMIQRAIASGLRGMMLPNIDMDSIPTMNKLVLAYPEYCFPMMGLHPCSVKEDYEVILNHMKLQFMEQTFFGVGETGIDLYWDKTFKTQQIDAFEQQIGWAKEFDLPIIIHSRDSLDLTIEIISTHQKGGLRGIFHCFGGTMDQVRQIEATGFKVGIGGVITFKKAGLDQLLPQIPLNMIVLETDAPYLAPVPHRGKRNESSYLLLVAARVAECLNKTLQEVSAITNENAEAVFGKKV
jgi:TatD DNase family protein